MPATPDDHGTGAARSVDPEDVLAAAEDAHLAARKRVPRQRQASGQRPAERPYPPPRPHRLAQLAIASVVAAGLAAAQGFLPVVLVMALVQLAEGRGGSLGGLARLGLAGWLLGHGVPLRTGAGALGLAPLVLTGLAAWRVGTAGIQVTRAVRARRTGSVRGAVTVAAAVGCAYAMFGALAAVALDSPGVGVSAGRAALHLGVFGFAAAGVGAAGATGAFSATVGRTPGPIRNGVRTGLVAALIVLGAGAGLAGLALALAGGDAADTIAAYRTGVAGQAGITLLCLAYAPNAATWAAAYLVGPGFAVGEQTTVRITEVSVDTLPALPLFSGLPDGQLGGAGLALLAVPAAAGMVAGVFLVRGWSPAGSHIRGGARSEVRSAPPANWLGLLGAAVLAGPVAGLVLGLTSAVSAGPLGGGRLSQLGPVAWQVGLIAAAVVAGGALLGTVTTRLAGRM